MAKTDRLVALGRGLGHPVRAAILQFYCAEPDALHAPIDASKALGQPLGVVSYHVRTLSQLGLLELRRTGQARGAVVHEYGLARGVAVAVAALSEHT